MTIGKSSRKASVRSSIRAPKFLDKASGFYGRLDELEAVEGSGAERNVTGGGGREDGGARSPRVEKEEAGAADFSEGVVGDDGETLLQRKPGRHSSRWRRSSRRRQKEGEKENAAEPHAAESEAEVEERKVEEEERGREPALVHFPTREDADDQVLIRDKKAGGAEEGEEERGSKREQEKGMKVAKRNTMKNYRKALDRAFRRGWDAFVANLYSVTLAPVTPPPSSGQKNLHRSVLAEFR
ncbi:phosphoglycerate kinase [Betta splendens]|uniref:Phosphoglycerate kinase n=1 Tax=Betta splendens TaxID=158456 RepID=A0A8M1HAJ0_BETSP|nr:phosphoglycerate kinase [Betta splendens]XP_040925463.1 phosphoglycerate kinase [Betta splendens]